MTEPFFLRRMMSWNVKNAQNIPVQVNNPIKVIIRLKGGEYAKLSSPTYLRTTQFGISRFSLPPQQSPQSTVSFIVRINFLILCAQQLLEGFKVKF
ncbi:MAG: hypothetical protein AAF573_23090 [Bacteroidota bacterium]